MAIISVVIPVYNVDKYLERCLDSVLAQTFKDFDVILINDGSKDNSPQICDEYVKKDKRIHVIHQTNRGVSVARNNGIEWSFNNSKSEWITFVDSDDWIHPSMLEVLYNAAIIHKSGVSVCAFKSMNLYEKQNEFIEDIYYEKKTFEDFYSIEEEEINVIVAWGKLYKKEYFSDIKFPVGKINEDIYTIYKVLDKCDNIVVIKNVLYYYYLTTNSIMRCSWSPKRLDEISGYEEMIEYMDSKGYSRAKKRMIETYYWSLDRQIKLILETKKPEYKKYLKLLKKKLKKAIFKYRDIVNVNVKERFWLLEDLYPIIMKGYWKMQQLKRIEREN